MASGEIHIFGKLVSATMDGVLADAAQISVNDNGTETDAETKLNNLQKQITDAVRNGTITIDTEGLATRDYINEQIKKALENAGTLKCVIVKDQLPPVSEAKENTIYFLKNPYAGTRDTTGGDSGEWQHYYREPNYIAAMGNGVRMGDYYDEYILVPDGGSGTPSFERLGTIDVDMSDFITNKDLEQKRTELNQEIKDLSDKFALKTTVAALKYQYATPEYVEKYYAGKQDKLTFDKEPTENSENVLTSGAIYEAIEKEYFLSDDAGTFETGTASDTEPTTAYGLANAVYAGTFTAQSTFPA